MTSYSNSKKIRLISLGFLIVLTFFIWYSVALLDRQGILTVAFLNVGQGDAILIKAPTGNDIILDGGPGSYVLKEIGRRLPFFDREIDMVMASHPDTDHVEGLPAVLNNYKVGFLILPEMIADNKAFEAIKNISGKKNIKSFQARRGTKINLRGGAYLEILFPDRDASLMDTNQGSFIAKLVYGETSFLFTGDSPSAVEDYISGVYGRELKSNVLKVAHHGSKTSASAMFLGAVDPEYSVVSVGKKNRYGHPDKETLVLLEKIGTKILRTDELGTIVFESDGEVVIQR